MSDSTRPEDIAQDVERQREQLADTVDALQAKLDVKAQAKHKADTLRDSATTDSGKPRPELVAAGVAVVVLVVGLVVLRRRR